MSFFWISFLQALTARLTSWRTWLLVLLLPLTALGALRLLPPEETSAPVRVGVVLPEEGGGEFWKKIQARNGLVVTFLPSDLAQAERQVSLGRWDCALVLPEDFEDRLARRERSELFTLLIGPGSAVYPMVRETAAACAAELLAPGMAEDYLLDSGIAGEDLETVRPRLQEVLGAEDRVLVALETVDGAPLDPLALADRGASRLIAGLTAILLLLWALLTAMDLGRWLDSPFARRLVPLKGENALLLPRLAAALIPALCAGALALLLTAERPLAGILALVPYLLFWGGAALVLARYRPVWSALPVLLPFVPVLALLLSPILLDLSLLIPALRPVVRWGPVALFLNACGGQWGGGLLLLGGGALLPLLSRLLEGRETSRKNLS